MFSTGVNFVAKKPAEPAVTVVTDCFTASGTWSCCPGTVCAEVVAIGGGGAGGAGTNGGNTNVFISVGGGGGGAGAALASTITSGLSATECVIIGSGAASVNFGNNGGAGGASCFGAHLIANGGAGGLGGKLISGFSASCTVTGGAGGCSSPNGGNSTASTFGIASTSNTSGGTALGKPGAGGGGGAWARCFGSCSNNNGAGGGAGNTFCGITLGTGGAGGNTSSAYGGTPTNGSSGSGYGAAGGGGAGKYGPGTISCSGAGAAGFVMVNQYVPVPEPVEPFKYTLDELTFDGGTEVYWYSLKKVRADYTGDCIEILRESDDATQDIGFVDDYVDEAAIETFCTGDVCRVTKWYDQSETSPNVNLGQTGPTLRPVIFTGGQVVTGQNGKAAIHIDKATYDGSHFVFATGGIGYEWNNYSLVGVWEVLNGAGSNTGVFGPSDTNLQGLELLNHNVIDVPTLLRLEGNSKTDGDGIIYNSGLASISEIYNGSSAGVSSFINGTTVPLSATGPQQINYNGVYALGTYSGLYSTNVKVQEFGFVEQSLASQRTTLFNNLNAWWGFQTPDPIATWSLRKYNIYYTGSAIEVRRSSDNTTLNIGWVNNDLDTGALLDFVGTGDGFVTTVYEQYGVSPNLGITGPTEQPKIVDSGVLVTSGGKPAIKFDGVNDYIRTTTNVDLTTNVVNFFVWEVPEIDEASYVSSSNNSMEVERTGIDEIWFAGSVVGTGNSATTDRTAHTVSFYGPNSYWRKNTIEKGAGNPGSDTAAANLFVGAKSNLTYFNDGYFQEHIIYDKVLDIGTIQNIESNIMSYWNISIPEPPAPPALPSGYALLLDAADSDSYPGTGTTWTDLGPNAYEFTLNSASVWQDNGGLDKYMDFSNGIAKHLVGGALTDTATSTTTERTYIVYSELRPFPPDWRTLARNADATHVVITENGQPQNIGIYDQVATFRDSGFDLDTLSPDYRFNPHLYFFEVTSADNEAWQLYYDDQVSSPAGTASGATSSDLLKGINSVGAWHADSTDPTVYSQEWGKIWFFAIYDRVLTEAEKLEVYDYTQSI